MSHKCQHYATGASLRRSSPRCNSAGGGGGSFLSAVLVNVSCWWQHGFVSGVAHLAGWSLFVLSLWVYLLFLPIVFVLADRMKSFLRGVAKQNLPAQHSCNLRRSHGQEMPGQQRSILSALLSVTGWGTGSFRYGLNEMP